MGESVHIGWKVLSYERKTESLGEVIAILVDKGVISGDKLFFESLKSVIELSLVMYDAHQVRLVVRRTGYRERCHLHNSRAIVIDISTVAKL